MAQMGIASWKSTLPAPGHARQALAQAIEFAFAAGADWGTKG
jgi:hypothetical protein